MSEFSRRFRLTKQIFFNILMPMVFTEQKLQIHTDLKGFTCEQNAESSDSIKVLCD